ncbi:MAG TPA: leucine-rich repeat domain-containing protein [Verrucomicrobiae bacterium]|nr:leucine-rich repeat domain-containing protein [Verrucomicrobiae bacterium]
MTKVMQGFMKALILSLFIALTPLLLPNAVEAFDYTNDYGTWTYDYIYTIHATNAEITGYSGSGGALIIPDTVPYVFSDHHAIAVTSIGGTAPLFTDSATSAVASVIIPSGIVNVGSLTFNYCRMLTNIDIPEGVTNIGNSAFQYCIKLSSVVIPSSVTRIGDFAFGQCIGLSSVCFRGNAPTTIGTSIFSLDPVSVVYYLFGTTGWPPTLGGKNTVLWNPQAQFTAMESGQLSFNITGPTNATIVVEASDNLSNYGWIPVSTNILTNGVSSFSDSQWNNYSGRFYRFRSP